MMDEASYLATLHALWQRHWPAGIPGEPVYPHGKRPITHYLRAWARQQPDKPAVVFYGHTLSYGELDRLSDRFAALLAERGIGPGDRVSVFMPNCPQFHIAFFGILKRGAIYAPVSPLSRAFELHHQLTDSGAVSLVALDQLMPVVREVKPQCALREVFVTSFADVLPAEPALPLPDLLRAPRVACPDAIDLLPALAACTAPTPGVEIGWDDVAALNYTGGTTGLPKGCIHTHGHIAYTAASATRTSAYMTSDTVALCFLPEFWIAGQNLGLTFPTFAGGTLVLMARWDPVAFMAAVQRYRVDSTAILVDGIDEVLNHPRLHEFDLRSLQHARSISFIKKLNPDYRRRWREVTGATLCEASWGMTETNTSDTFTTGFQDDDFDLKQQPIFAGLPVPGTEFKVCDFATGELLPLGEEGELCVRSPAVLAGYWRQPEATARAIRDGWLHTGDAAILDTEGFLHFLGRRKEMLKVNGMAVFPAEIEALLGQHPALQGSAVVGRPDPKTGERAVAFVLVKPEARGTLDEAAVSAWCAERISVHKVPEVRFVDALPMTATGKVRKDELAKQL